MHTVNGILGSSFGVDTSPWYRPVPIIGEFGPGALVALIVQAIIGFALYRVLNRPKIVDYLIETEVSSERPAPIYV